MFNLMFPLICCVILEDIEAYSLDLRERIVGFMEQDGSKAEATRRFGVSKWTVYHNIGVDD